MLSLDTSGYGRIVDTLGPIPQITRKCYAYTLTENSYAGKGLWSYHALGPGTGTPRGFIGSFYFPARIICRSLASGTESSAEAGTVIRPVRLSDFMDSFLAAVSVKCSLA